MKIKLKDLIRSHVKYILFTINTHYINIAIHKLDKISEYNHLSVEQSIRYS